ncbi:MAG: segregation/condensation protein A [Coriobacteriales bacterium]|jgi:segregation and condensation protein A|nr:segregation/condensation protein A [Coriobacteriales bacterium]
MSYRVKIESFEGPFELLLSLVSDNKLDIGSVSVAEIADQYLASLDAMGTKLDMDVASDFLVVASTLLQLKAAALLPSEDDVEYDDEEMDLLSPSDAREILISRLIAYKQFKNAAAALNARLESTSRLHSREAALEPKFVGLMPDYLENVTLHELGVICADLASRREVFLLNAEHIAQKPIPVETRVEALSDILSKKRKMSFKDALGGSHDAAIVVVNFLAVLELYHRGIIDMEQEEQYGNITLAWRDEEDWAPAVVTDDEDGEDDKDDDIDTQRTDDERDASDKRIGDLEDIHARHR